MCFKLFFILYFSYLGILIVGRVEISCLLELSALRTEVWDLGVDFSLWDCLLACLVIFTSCINKFDVQMAVLGWA